MINPGSNTLRAIKFRRTIAMRFSVKNLGLAAFGVALTAAGFVLLDGSSHGATQAPVATMPAMPVRSEEHTS